MSRVSNRIRCSQRFSIRYLYVGLLLLGVTTSWAVQDAAAVQDAVVTPSQNVWPELAPGETTAYPGRTVPPRQKDPSVIRVTEITQPTLDIYPAEKPNGTAILVLPGGGYTLVVPNKEGSEAAPFFNELGVSLFVLRYRTGNNKEADVWKKPAQDGQRALRWIRANADRWKIDPDKVGVLGFSAGGQVSSFLLTADKPLYEAIDEIDQQNFRPSFGVLLYAWRLLNEQGDLKDGIKITADTPETIIIQTNDDLASDARGAIKFYLGLRDAKISTELHIFRTGGHGYGVRSQKDSVIHKWPNLVKDWLELTVFQRGKN